MSTKISQLTAASTFKPTDEFERNSAGTTPSARETRAQLSSSLKAYPLMNYGGYSFDGSTDYLDTNALTGIADGKKGTFVWVGRFANTASAVETITNSTGAAFRVFRSATGAITVQGENAAGTVILNIATTSNVCASAGTYVVLISFDLATPSSARIYVNDVSQAITESAFTDDTIDYTVTEWALGGSPAGTLFFTGDMYVVWFDASSNLEFNTESVRRKFADVNNVPVFMGRNGELPTGSAPIMFHAYDDHTRWADQRGTASTTWTENGTPGAAGTALSGQFAPLEEYSIPKTVTGDYTVSRTDKTIINNRAATNTLTLPSAASYKGRRLHILTIQAQAVNSASSNVVPITGGAAGTAILAAADGAWALLESDGTNWQIIAS